MKQLAVNAYVGLCAALLIAEHFGLIFPDASSTVAFVGWVFASAVIEWPAVEPAWIADA